jgi:site-specific DNA recombinase
MRQIISTLFPEKLSFDKTKGRPGRINEAVQLIYKLDKGFSEIKKPDSSDKLPKPGEVTPLGLISNHFLSDLKLLACISA